MQQALNLKLLTFFHIPPGFCSHSWWKADFVNQIISFESSHPPEVIILLVGSYFKTPSAAQLTNSSWLALVWWCSVTSAFLLNSIHSVASASHWFRALPNSLLVYLPYKHFAALAQSSCMTTPSCIKDKLPRNWKLWWLQIFLSCEFWIALSAFTVQK